MSKLYHPDKHQDPVKQKQAELIFNRTKKAYEGIKICLCLFFHPLLLCFIKFYTINAHDLTFNCFIFFWNLVLIDAHKRAIYDTLGSKGLETDGWDIVQRTKTPQEIREEYERLQREKEERRLDQRTNPRGSIIVGVNATDLFDTYRDEYNESSGFPTIEISSMAINQALDVPLSMKETLSMSGSLSSANGVGNGTIGAAFRHVLSSQTWTEFQVAAGQGPLFSL